MTRNPTFVRASAPVRDALQLFQTLDVRHLPVVNADGELVGMLSDRDLRAFTMPVVVNGEWITTMQAALDARVSSLMSADPLYVNVESDADDIVELMLEHKIGAVPVADADGDLVGIVSYVDLLRELPLER